MGIRKQTSSLPGSIMMKANTAAGLGLLAMFI